MVDRPMSDSYTVITAGRAIDRACDRVVANRTATQKADAIWRVLNSRRTPLRDARSGALRRRLLQPVFERCVAVRFEHPPPKDASFATIWSLTTCSVDMSRRNKRAAGPGLGTSSICLMKPSSTPHCSSPRQTAPAAAPARTPKIR